MCAFAKSPYCRAKNSIYERQIFIVSMMLLSVVSSCRLNDNRIRGSYGHNPDHDSQPDSFYFSPISDVGISQQEVSEIVQIKGLNTPADVSMGEGYQAEYRVCVDANCSVEVQSWSSSLTAKIVKNNQYLQLRLISSSSYNTPVQAEVMVGGISSYWSVTTLVAPLLALHKRWKTVVSGAKHSCGISMTGRTFCWGSDQYGQLGENTDGDNADENIPVEVNYSNLTAGTSFIQLTAGTYHTCGLTSDHKAFCWGRDNNGQLGENADGDNLDEDIPVAVDTSALSPGASFIFLTAGSYHTCGISSDGKSLCWGLDNAGQLGENSDGDNLDESIPVKIDTSNLGIGNSFVYIAAGFQHTCGISNNRKTFCWGSDSNGQLGENADGDNLDENIPVEVDTTFLTTGSSFLTLALGSLHSCGLASDGRSFCWGSDSNGQLGENADGDNLDENIPVEVETSALNLGENFISLSARANLSCGLSSWGRAFCWGSDSNGQLGENADGDNLDESIPVEVETSALSGGENFILLEAGTFHNCGLSSYGHIYCWGSDSSGQLGENEDGDNLQEDTPSLVDTSELTDLTGFISLALGNWFSCGLAVNGKAYCWGGDQNGQLGENSDGDNLPENIPVQVDNSALGSGVRFVSLTAGESHACGLSSEGKAYCWGKGFYEQLGNGNFVDQNIPTPVDLSNLPAGSRFVEIHAGGEFTCGLASDGKAYCWGRDNHGQLGENADGDNLDEPIPVAVDTSALSTGTSFSSLVTGYAHACGLSSDGKAYCWGTDSNGQLGENADGDNLDENIPVEVDTSAFTAGSSFKSLAAGGGSHTCGLASDGKAYCWGLDNKGQLGENADGDNLSESIPVAVDTSSLTPGSQFISLHLGGAHSCGIASDGKAYCWGDDQYGQLGENADSDNLDENIPVEVNSSVLGPGGSFTALSLGGGHTCGLSSSGKAYCWGANFFGQLGESPSGGNLKEDIPVEVDDSAL